MCVCTAGLCVWLRVFIVHIKTAVSDVLLLLSVFQCLILIEFKYLQCRLLNQVYRQIHAFLRVMPIGPLTWNIKDCSYECATATLIGVFMAYTHGCSVTSALGATVRTG